MMWCWVKCTGTTLHLPLLLPINRGKESPWRTHNWLLKKLP